VFEADLSASLLKLQRTLDFLSLRNLASNELFFTILSLVTNYFYFVIYNNLGLFYMKLFSIFL